MKKKLFSLKIVLISGFLLPPLAISLLTYLGILTVIEPTIESQNAELLKGRLETFASSIEQDIANGFYPSIVQKSKLVYEAAKLGKLSVQLTDGQIVYSEKSESLTGHDQGKYRSIKVPITQIGSDQVSAEIHASVNVEPSHDYALRLRELLSIIAVLGGFIGAFVGLCVSLLIWFPLRRLIRAADGEGPEALSRYAKRSVFREIHALENALSGMGSRIVDLMEAQRRNERDVAIAGLTQMLAHDVRKPFSMLKTGLGMLQAASNDPQKFKSSLSLLISEVERATKSVDGMLADVMEIGSPSQELIQEAVSPDSLIESTLGEIFRVYPQAQISIAYELKHTNMVSVHVKKINRLFANIVGNALQAMNYSGNIWFKTETKGSFVQFCIGNEGSYIAQENISKLFEAFFTSGKKTGTGLGLAIAQKVVHAHGGAIWCHSSKSPSHPRGLVEFYFTLPAAPHTKLLTTAHLPRHSTEITRMLALLKRDAQESLTASDTRSGNALHNNKSSGNGTDGITLKNVPYDLFQTELLHLEPLQQELIQRAHSLAMPLEILLVDDETIYRTALASWIEDSTELRSLCRIHHAVGSAQALAVIQQQPVHLVVTDIDMGPQSLNGFELVQELRKNPVCHALIFVHSNRIVTDDHRRAGQLGADGFLPKPMSKGQLLKLLLQTVHHREQLSRVSVVSPGGRQDSLSMTRPHPALTLSPAVKIIAVIDDEKLFRDQWPPFLKGFKTQLYSCAEDFLKDWEHLKEYLHAVITDKFLGSGMDGITFGNILRAQSANIPIILSTNELGAHGEGEIFDLVVDKDAAIEAPKITQHILAKNSRSTARYSMT